ncbi:MAG: hypothetical protein FWG78_01990 [Coriobacteriia bacterium]|nr:hypothetical protein [Coriobacteriia bacterium]
MQSITVNISMNSNEVYKYLIALYSTETHARFLRRLIWAFYVGSIALVPILTLALWFPVYSYRAFGMAHGISVLFAAKQRRHPKQLKPIPWEKVRNIDNEEKFLCILHGYPKKRIIIPKSAFSTQEEIDKFIAICSEHMNRCHGIRANCE